MHTFDGRATLDAQGNHLGKPFNFTCKTHDGKTADSTGAFLIGELERLDLTLHEPLAAVTWGRDIMLREDVTIADEVSSFTISSYASPGGLGTGNAIGNGKAWIGKDTTQVSSISVDIGKVTNPLTPWGLELKYTVLELESAAKVGRPIDQQKYQALALKHQMDIDEMVYIGDTPAGFKGLVNAASVTPTNVVAGIGGSTQWIPGTGISGKTPDEILSDVNTLIVSTWTNSAFAVLPNRMLLPPAQFGYISTAKVSQAGNVSILRYVLENNILTTSGKGKLDIFPVKWLVGAGQGGTIGTLGTVDRMMVYNNDMDRVRYPMTLLQRTPLQYDSIWQKTTYFCKLGVVETVYPQTLGYADAI